MAKAVRRSGWRPKALRHLGASFTPCRKVGNGSKPKGMRGNGRLKAWMTRMQRLKAMGREQRLKPTTNDSHPNNRARHCHSIPSSNGHTSWQDGCGTTNSGGIPNSSTAEASLTSRIITHVLICVVVRRMSSVLLCT